MKKILTLLATLCLTCTAWAQFGTVSPLHVEGNQLKDPHGNTVVLHGFMDTPSPYFNNYRWGGSCDDNTVSACITYFDRIFKAATDTAQGAYCNLFRLHLDPCWTNDNSITAAGFTRKNDKTYDPLGQEVGGEADISHFSSTRLKKYLSSLYYKIAEKAQKRGMYVIMRPPGVCPGSLRVGDYYQEYLIKVWDIVTQNANVRKSAGWLSIELANEPVSLKDANGNDNPKALHDYFQPIVDKIRANGFTGIIWVPGTGWQASYADYAKYPITGYNIGYAVHDYTGWYGCSDNHYDHDAYIKQFHNQVPVVDTNPIAITEIDWSPEKEGSGHYNEHGEWVTSNYGTWSTGSTSKWGEAYKALHDYYGNISMTLSGSHCYFDWDTYANSNFKTVVPAFGGEPEACGKACFDWYAEWAKEKQPRPDFKYQWSADQGNGKYLNPIVNADAPDCDVIRVNDTYYFLSTTMFHMPGATLMKSKDLVNWEYCANPLKQILDNDDYNLKNGKNHYSQGMWAGSLNYHNGKFYIYFPCSTWSYDSQSILLTATDPESAWQDTRLSEAYHDPGWLFDDGPNGDGSLYVACGIGDIYVNKLDPETFKKISSTKVISVGNGCEGSHMYHIGDYYYIYATYGGTEGSQTIFRSKNPMGPYEESADRVFKDQKIHQGALVETQTGEWWTVLFKDAGAIGRIPYLEPVTWEDGWPVLGKKGRDVSESGTGYAKPDVGMGWPKTYLPTNDPFVGNALDKQWQWNHNPDNNAWSKNDGWLRLNTTGITNDLMQARNSLTQRILGFNGANTAASKVDNSYGTIKMVVGNMQDGDVAGLAVFQDPYAFIAVRQDDGVRRLYSCRCDYTEYDWSLGQDVSHQMEEELGDIIDSDTIYLRTIVNYGTNVAKFYYSFDNKSWTKFGKELNMRYTLKIFVGQRFYLFNYATKKNGGYVDIDWFSTEADFTEEKFYTKEALQAMETSMLSDDDLKIASLTIEPSEVEVRPGESMEVHVYATGKSGYRREISNHINLTVKSNNNNIAKYENGMVYGISEGETRIIFTFIDEFGTKRTKNIKAIVSNEAAVKIADEDKAAVIATEYFTTDGRALSAPQRGITIVRQQLSNGQFRSKKILR
ncbi:MAG: family 43 glycosylhydrolase [Bacteroidaceae bacterium]|nr:family 43 glycosylhydrolase [Bacteroidaceae bacterium]